MDLINKKNVPVFHSDHGESVYELTGQGVDQNSAYSIANVVLLPEKMSKNHFHPRAEECYYILSGEGEIQLNDKVMALQAHDFIRIPPTVWHQIRNRGDRVLEFVVFCQPAWTADCSVFEVDSTEDHSVNGSK